MLLHLPDHIVYAMSQTFFHSIWQGIFISVLWASLVSIPGLRSAVFRYWSGLAAMIALFTMGIITYWMHYQPVQESLFLLEYGEATSVNPSIFYEDTISVLHPFHGFFIEHAPLISQIWVWGMVLLLIRLLMGYGYLKYIASGVKSKQHPILISALENVRGKMRLATPVVVSISNKVSGPMLVGWIKPVILFPVGLINALTPQEVEAIIAHELAHVKRHDWLINLVQSLIEVAFYYHPAVWWLSYQIREARENCCDDMAIENGYSPLFYARLLIRIKELQIQTNHSPSISLVGNSKTLLNRIQRILGQTQNFYTMKEKCIALGMITAVILVLTSSSFVQSEKDFKKTNNEATLHLTEYDISSEAEHEILDTIPKKESKKSVYIENTDPGKTIHVEIQDGEIIRLEVDGEPVHPDDYDNYTKEYNYEDGSHFGKMQGFKNYYKLDTDSLPIKIFGMDKDIFREWNVQGLGMDSMIIRSFPKGMRQLYGIEGKQNMPHFFFEGDTADMKSFYFGYGDLLPSFPADQLDEEMKSLRLHLENLEEGELKHLRRWERSRLDSTFQLNRERNLKEMEKMRRLQEESFRKLRNLERDSMRHFHFDMDQWRSVAPHFGGNVQERVGYELNRDGLLIFEKENKVELTGKHLKINGQKQPDNIYEKYKRIFEESSGIPVTKNSHLEFKILGEKHSNSLRRI